MFVCIIGHAYVVLSPKRWVWWVPVGRTIFCVFSALEIHLSLIYARVRFFENAVYIKSAYINVCILWENRGLVPAPPNFDPT